MKYLFLIICIAAIASFSGCKKETDTPTNYFLSMNIDGRSYSFNDSLAATKQSGNVIGLILYAQSQKWGRLQALFSDYTAGTYIDDYLPAPKIIMQFTITDYMYDNNNNQFYQLLLRPNPAGLANPISLTITKETDTYVEGNFSGQLNNAGVSYATITNGQFRIPFK